LQIRNSPDLNLRWVSLYVKEKEDIMIILKIDGCVDEKTEYATFESLLKTFIEHRKYNFEELAGSEFYLEIIFEEDK
jgi:hypothetical protein